MSRIAVQLVDVDQCPKCEGVWFDNFAPELLEILRAGHDRLPEQLQKSLEADHPTLESAEGHKYHCPRCGAELHTYWYGGDASRSFQVDGCSKGCGVWLDDGELGQAYAFLKGPRPATGVVKSATGILGRVELLRESRPLKE